MTKANGTLHLTLKKQWWDMIESGEKWEEYREIKPYWSKRLCRYGKRTPEDGEANNCIFGGCIFREICLQDRDICTEYDYVCFHYGRTARTMVFELCGIYIGVGNPQWGAPENKMVFCLVIGKRII